MVNKQMVISTIFMLIILLPVLGIVYLVLYFTGTMFLMPFVEQGQEIVEKTGYVPINEPGTMIDED